MRNYIIDTSALLRYLINDNAPQAFEIEGLLQQAKAGKITIYLPLIIVFELIFALEKFYKLAKGDVASKINTIVGTSYIEVQHRSILKDMITLYKNGSMSAVDCYLIMLAREKNARLISFDRKLQKRLQETSKKL